jgi:hypothetical protein
MLLKPHSPASKAKRALLDQFHKLHDERQQIKGFIRIRVVNEHKQTNILFLDGETNKITPNKKECKPVTMYTYTYPVSYLQKEYKKFFNNTDNVFVTFVPVDKTKVKELAGKIKALRLQMKALYTKENLNVN